MNENEFLMLVKSVNAKTLVSGDKSLRIVLEASNPDDIAILSNLSMVREVLVSFQIPQSKS